MKSANVLQSFKKCIVSFIMGIACTSLTYVIYVFDPINMIVEYNLQMRPNSILFSVWQKPPLDLHLKVYIFNITNPAEFLSGKEKLKVEEVGPYVYQEFVLNDNITFNDNDTMTYIPRRTIAFVPEMSISDPKKDIVRVANIPVLGVSSALHDAGFLVNYPLVQLANVMGSKPILNITAHEYLWGYDDPLVTLASDIVPNFINFRKFGVLDRMYDEGENIVTMNLRHKADMKEEKGRYLSIDKYNGSPGLAQWGYVDTENNETRSENTNCNTLQGATEGILFPPHLDKTVEFNVFRKGFCRALPIRFKKEVLTESGLPGYYYVLKDDYADPPDKNPNNNCYCQNICMKKGLSNVTPCYYNIPVAVSLPHFLDADPTLPYNIEGLKPDRKKHEPYVIIQQTFGVPIYVHSRMQTNLVMHHTRYNYKIAPFNDMTIPLFWFDLEVKTMPIYLTIILKLTLRILPVMQTVLMYLFSIVGVTMIILSLWFTLRILNRQQRQEEEKQEMKRNDSIDNPDLKIPLCNGQYTSINILPTLKQITSKTDIFS